MELLKQSAIFVVALGVLIKSADYFVESSEALGKWLKIPSFVIGLTIVSLGTSLPELITAIIAVYQHSSEIVLGNVVGSNIANILLILGVSSLFTKSMEIKWNIFLRDLPMFFASALMFCFVVWPLNPKDTYVTLGESILLVLGYLIYTFFSLFSQREKPAPQEKRTSGKVRRGQKRGKKNAPAQNKRIQKAKSPQARRKTAQDKTNKGRPELYEDSQSTSLPWWAFPLLAVSLLGIYYGAQFTIDSVIEISKMLKIAKDLIAISAVAVGTSLPELTVSIAAVRKKNYGIAFGNVVGSNIFNVFMVTGIPGIYANIIGPGVMISKSVNDFAMPFFMFTYILFLVILLDKKITRMEGMILLLCYCLFMGKLFAFM